jgi:hypothetical protein
VADRRVDRLAWRAGRASKAFSGMTFEDNPALASKVIYFSFLTLISTGYGGVTSGDTQRPQPGDNHRPALSRDLARKAGVAGRR